ncbi:MAG TPA: bifunctional phosphopantothenoylcysteine decarboxylase/phosphopantothenate--cysteine ligase CoaBC, partial [Thermoplasmatales archaeon]|nr:bifunctional phosphopantothenoylcysteine decarboxylase/phosphopantothenate--cysteine ligase CoaBC [Thermoplasmatales archaeon]
MHPSNDIRGSKSKLLWGKRIVLGVTGSIAAVETIKLARELIRHGADVIPVMTNMATRIIHPYALEFATGHKPIVELTGEVEHIEYCGEVEKPVDLLLIAPCTANTLSKITHGIDDTPVTTFATTALGAGIPILIVPAMHHSMYKQPFIQENIKACREKGIHFLEPIVEERKAKIPSVEEITAWSIRLVGKQDLKDKKILVVGGGTSEPIDDVRIISNRSSGKTAVALAETGFYRGGDVTLWYSRTSSEKPPLFMPQKRFTSIRDLLELIGESKGFDIIIVCAAISDYIPEKTLGKISSDQEELNIKLTKAPKILPYLRKRFPDSILVGFKIEVTAEESIREATKILEDYNLDYVVANTINAFEKE